jgi:protein-S-isoprenylcysteine O-methyltransferase Ste14
MLLLIKNLVFTLVAPGTVALWAPLFLTRARSPASPAMFAGGVALWLAGGAIYAWCVWDFALFGRGTPAPIDAPKRLVVRGLYRWTRNPMYLGVLTVLLGWALAYGAASLLLYMMSFGAIVHLFIVLYEEPHLRRVFGREYEDYCAHVHRWWPRPPRRSVLGEQ